MAIVSEVQGLVVTIDVAGQNLAEYDDNDVEEPQPLATMKYVEATSGANFGVATSYDPFVFSHVNDHIRYHLYLDAKHIRAWTHSPNKIVIGHRSVLEHVRSNLGDRMVKKQFSFAELQINEGSADFELWGQLSDLGTITVECFRVRYEEAPPHVPTRNPRQEAIRAVENTQSLLNNDQIAEKNLKGRAVSHQAKLLTTNPMLSIVEEILIRPSNAQPDNRRTVYISKDPFATFHFKYRSRRALQGLLILPRTPSPVPLEERPIDELMPEEMRALLQMQRDRAADAADFARLKKEHKHECRPPESHEEMDGVEVIEHWPKKAPKSSPVELAEVIDLCGED